MFCETVIHSDKKMRKITINDIDEYFVAMEKVDSKWTLAVDFDQKWKPYPSQDKQIRVMPDQNIENRYWFYAMSEGITKDDIAEHIYNVINVNIEALKKFEVVKAKVEELKELLTSDNMTCEKISKLKFVFEEDKAKSKRSYKKVKKEDSNEESNITTDSATTEVVEVTETPSDTSNIENGIDVGNGVMYVEEEKTYMDANAKPVDIRQMSQSDIDMLRG